MNSDANPLPNSVKGYQEIKSDVITYAEGLAAKLNCKVVIPHVCNDCGVMGAGVALALRNRWPKIMTTYKGLCTMYGAKACGYVTMPRVAPGIQVANMIAQTGFAGDDFQRPPLRYGALAKCMRKVADLSYPHITQETTEIVAPAFGSGLAGGDWAVIRQMILEIWVDRGHNVTICRI